MTAASSLPLGARIPDSVHAVSASLPTMQDVIGYEEKNPAVVRHLSSGYPRFVVHPYLNAVAESLRQGLGLDGNSIWLASSRRAAEQLARVLPPGISARVIEKDNFAAVAFPSAPDADKAAKLFLQHTGAAPSSRRAEDYLLETGRIEQRQVEETFPGDSASELRQRLAAAFGAQPQSVLLANSGMNAFYATFRAVSQMQRARGRTHWIQLGWLYLDTICILKKFVEDPQEYHQLDLFDRQGLFDLLEREGSRIAGVVTEVPTNPLLQTLDLAAVAERVHRAGAKIVLDPTLATPINLDVLPYADVVVNSLTKFVASEGDVMMGAAVINPARADAEQLREQIAAELEPVYQRDVARLALQARDLEPLVHRINATTPKLVEYLAARPQIRQVYWSLRPASRENYLRLARTPESVGGMLSFELSIPVDQFYDRWPLAKGPSFGMKRTLLCPFMYLAHYDLVSTENGRAELKRHGIAPELIRLSVGTESIDELIAAFEVVWS